jgi:F-type H+-transporting ATPase subunit delta
LFDVALAEKSDPVGIERQLAAFAELVASHADLEKALLNPAVPAPRKRAAVVELSARLPSAVLRKLLVLLAERDRLVLLPDVLAMYRERLLDHMQIVRAEITTAAPLAPERAQEIERNLAQATGRGVALTSRVDPSLIGGLVARVGGTVYDGSITTQLAKIRKRLVAGSEQASRL